MVAPGAWLWGKRTHVPGAEIPRFSLHPGDIIRYKGKTVAEDWNAPSDVFELVYTEHWGGPVKPPIGQQGFFSPYERDYIGEADTDYLEPI